MIATPTQETMTFGELEISFDPRVLRPRPWTAAQSRWAADLLTTAPRGPVLELCCGAGQIGLLAVHHNDRELVMVDLNPAACDFARANAAAADSTVDVREGRMDDVLGDRETFPVIIADPPWVPSDQTSDFPEDPLTAIDGGPAGLDVVWTCLDVIATHLAPDGSALLQLSTTAQVRLVEERLAQRPEHQLRVLETQVHTDQGVIARVVREV